MEALRRIGYLTKIEMRWCKYLLAAYLPVVAIWTIVLLWLSGSEIISWHTAQELLKFVVYSLFVVGAILANVIFADAHDKRSRVISAQLLPARAREQVAAKWLVSFLLWFVVWTVGIFLSLMLTDYSASAFSDFPSGWIHLGISGAVMTAASDVANVFIAFAVWHSVFFFGGIYFRRQRLLKTAMILFVLIACGVLLLMKVAGIEKEMLFSYMPALTSVDTCRPLLVNLYFDPLISSQAFLFIEKMLLVVPLFLWWLSIIRLQETER
ncbi:MAG: hypothetical protein WCP79_15140 [Bacillota bacterium]